MSMLRHNFVRALRYGFVVLLFFQLIPVFICSILCLSLSLFSPSFSSFAFSLYAFVLLSMHGFFFVYYYLLLPLSLSLFVPVSFFSLELSWEKWLRINRNELSQKRKNHKSPLVVYTIYSTQTNYSFSGLWPQSRGFQLLDHSSSFILLISATCIKFPLHVRSL